MNKRTKILTGIGDTSLIIVGGIIYGGKTYAEEVSNMFQDTFVSIIANKLGVSENEVESAIEETRSEMKESIEKERREKIDSAVENEDLTERQAELLSAMHEIRSENFEDGQRQKGRVMKDSILEDLNEKGLEVTQEELDDLRDAMLDIDWGGLEGRGKGMGRHNMF